MPSLYATAFEGLMYALLALALRRAWRNGRAPAVLRLLVGVLYGVLLEAATIAQLDAYHYGRFWVMVTPEVPLAIGVGWGVIVDGVRAYTRNLNLAPWQRAVLNGLLALNIDLAMDAIAIRLGFWDWGQGFDFQFFGVPWANFWAWFWVVAGFTLALETLDGPGWRGWLAPWAALALGVLVVLGTNALLVFGLHPLGVANEAVALVLGLALLGAVWSRFWERRQPARDPWPGQVAAAFHGYFLLAGVLSGAAFRPPWLLVVGVLMALLAHGLYGRRARGQGSSKH